MIAIAYNAKLVNKTKTWVDSGATKYMCNKEKAILDKDKQSIVYTEHSVKSIDSGEVVVNMKLNKNEKNPVKLKDTCRIYEITSCIKSHT